MELNLYPIFADAEQCRSRINAFSHGFVASADISHLLFVANNVIFLAMEQGVVEENVITGTTSGLLPRRELKM